WPRRPATTVPRTAARGSRPPNRPGAAHVVGRRRTRKRPGPRAASAPRPGARDTAPARLALSVSRRAPAARIAVALDEGVNHLTVRALAAAATAAQDGSR
ncbi:hypothetical protein, partial [Streptomyces canarius]